MNLKFQSLFDLQKVFANEQDCLNNFSLENKETQTEPIKPDNLAQEKALKNSIDELITEIRKLNQVLK